MSTQPEPPLQLLRLARLARTYNVEPLAIVALEALKPISFFCASLLVFFRPFADFAVFTFSGRRFGFGMQEYDGLIAELEERPRIEAAIKEIETLWEERS